MAYGESIGHKIDDVTWPWNVKIVTLASVTTEHLWEMAHDMGYRMVTWLMTSVNVLIVTSVCLGARYRLSQKSHGRPIYWTDSVFVRTLSCFLFWQVNSVAETLEFEIFRQHRQLVNSAYRRTAWRLVFSLRKSESLRRDISEKKRDVTQLVTELRYGRQLTDELAQNSEASTSELVDGS